MSQMLNVLRKLILNDCNHGKNHLLKMNHSKFQKENKICFILFFYSSGEFYTIAAGRDPS